MQMLSEDDLDLRDMTDDELERAWDLWFDLAQTTNDADPPYSHGVLAGMGASIETARPEGPRPEMSGPERVPPAAPRHTEQR